MNTPDGDRSPRVVALRIELAEAREREKAMQARIERLRAVAAVSVRVNDAAQKFEGWRQIGWSHSLSPDERATVHDLHDQMQAALNALQPGDLDG